MNIRHVIVMIVCLMVFTTFFPMMAQSDDCATYTAPLSVPATTETQYVANVVSGNQRRLTLTLNVASAPYRYDDVVELLERIETTLLPYFPQGVPTYNYEYFVFDRSIVKNYANAWDGGPISVSEQLILESESVDVLAFVQAHEMSHIISQHSARYLQEVEGIAHDYWERLNQDIRVTDPERKKARDKERLAVFEQGSVNSETLMQPQEIESDTFAAHVATRAGYNPEIVARFFDRMAEEHGNNPTPPTHPGDLERAKLLRCFTDFSSGPAHEDLDALFRTVQDRLFEQRRTIEKATQKQKE